MRALSSPSRVDLTRFRGNGDEASGFVFPTDRRRRTLAYFEPAAQNRLYGPSEGLTDARSPEADRGEGIRFSLRRRHRPYPVIFDADSLARPHRIRNDTGQPTSGSRGNTDPSPRNVGSSRAMRGTLPLLSSGFSTRPPPAASKSEPSPLHEDVPLVRVGRLRGQEPVSPTLAVSRHRLPTAHHATRARDLNTPHALPAP